VDLEGILAAHEDRQQLIREPTELDLEGGRQREEPDHSSLCVAAFETYWLLLVNVFILDCRSATCCWYSASSM
jgi:hypothetical protein